ncbi:TRAP transporter substrate-binding protein DctP [Ruegeria faecimaris]|uniref:TRAP-type C4-dicarboxylate transport system, substrate-binding protein n=1 Tax=Ruegeria faecimaris TaxID=686389 RepID=A0A521EH27_9RHOB|nr:TRAP transporter substrate-binding protein DctP [Ruegeria faecimaris]SMO82781.1 TRAP-type C4-dicarboxylate transport system, substrate-binding protein [Ruegeria faecimaris]
MLNRFKKTVAIASLAAMSAGSVFASDEEFTFKIVSTAGDADSPQGKSITMWAERMSELSDGRITGQTFFQGELGGQQEVYDQMLRGNVDMLLEVPQTSYDERIGVMNLPYLVSTWEEANEAFSEGGWIEEIVNPLLADTGVKWFGAYPEGFGGVATAGGYATNYEDAKNLNMKVRAQTFFPIPQTINAMGFQAVPIDWNEVYTSIQTGVVSGDSGNVIYWDYEYFGDVLDYFVATQHRFNFSGVMMSNEVWNSLDMEDQAIVSQAAQEVIDKQFAEARAEDEKWIKTAQENGMEYIVPTDEEIGSWAKVVREQVWGEAEAVITTEIMDKVRASAPAFE